MSLQSAYFRNFNGGPKVLLWGDRDGMHALSGFLRKLLITPAPATLSGICTAVDRKTITVRMRANRRDTGMRPNGGGLEWTLRLQSADDFAELIDALASSRDPGHQYLTCGVSDEIIVMVSRGEYPETLRP